MTDLLVRYPASNELEICLTGELDLITAPQVRQVLDGALNTPPIPATVALEVSGLSFMDSQGLSVVIRGAKLARASGSRFVLRNPRPQITRLMEITGVHRLLDADEPRPSKDVTSV